MPKSTPIKKGKGESSTRHTPLIRVTSLARQRHQEEPTGYVKFCQENRDRIKEDFPDLKGRAILDKLNDEWWDSDENPKKGNRPVKKAKKVKDASEKENVTKEKKSKKEKKKEVEASSDE